MPDNDKNDSFERFFQTKTEDYEIPFREEDWLKLEKKLDLRDAQAAYRNKLRWIAAAALVIVSLLGYFTYDNHNRLNQISQQMEQNNSQPAVQPQFDLFTMPDEFKSANDENQPAEYADAGISDEADAENNNTNMISHRTEIEKEQGNKPTSDSFSMQYPDGLEFSNVSSHFLSQLKTLPPAATRIQFPEELNRQNSSSIPLLAVADPDIDQPSAHRFSIGLVTGPDVSSVGSIADFHKPGYKIGLMVEYNISSDFSVSTGAVHSVLRYSTQRQSYNPPVYWSNDITPYEMTGECLLIDIPINLKYNFLNFKNSRFFASAGLSSYIMMSEEYSFKYNEDDYGLMTNWSGKTGTKHWLSNASFSIGYELDLHPNWGLRAEPFIKTPVSEVGWSNVKLYSAGSVFSLTYRI